ncbi:MAG: hypothetical protein QOJ29_2333 [Thermoleophilaceae bacterium]|jgi:MFS family permease|nr:hypothetical protein [Thermoleophilaceae bacterium]
MNTRQHADTGAGVVAAPESNLWRNRDFVKLWGSETISQLGSQITVFALPLTAILTLHATAAELGFVTAAQFAAIFAVTLFAGVWLDAHQRRPVLFAANLGRAAIIGLVPVLFAFDALTIPLLCVIALVGGVLTAMFDVAYIVYMPSLVRKENLVDANAKLEATYSIAEIGGPGLGGALVQVFTAPAALLIDAVTYLLAAFGVGSIRRPEPVPPVRENRAGVWAEIRDGFRTTLGDPILRPLVAVSAWFNMFERVVLMLYLLYGVRTLHLSPGLLGAVMAAGSLGALAGTAVASRAGRRAGVGRTVTASILLGAVALALLPVAHGDSKTLACAVLISGFVFYGFGLAVFNVFSLTIRAMIIPQDLFGRVTATYKFISHGTLPLGGLVGGLLAVAFGVREAMAIAVVALILGAVMFAFTGIRHLTDKDLARDG